MTEVVPVLEIGGTHVTAALADPEAVSVSGTHRAALDASGSAEAIVATLLRCASALEVRPRATWGVAVPGPFDYAGGIGRFRGVGKFDALYGFDLRSALSSGLPDAPAGVRFLNDAHAFGIGEHAAGTMTEHRRGLALTLGTGVGSAFLADGVVVDSGPSVPPEGRVDLLRINGRPLEETVSRAAILAAYGRPSVDVADIASAARSGAAAAHDVLRSAFGALGTALRPWVRTFGATIVVVGGSMADSWDLVEPALRSGLTGGPDEVLVVRARLGGTAALVGAGIWATR